MHGTRKTSWHWSVLLLAAVLLSGGGLGASAQKAITITSFYLAENDMDAIASYPVIDQNGYPCALIKVQKEIKGLSAEVGSLNAMKVDDTHTGETWIYVPFGIRHIKLLHRDGNSDEYQIPISVEKGRVYIMEVSTTAGSTGGRYIQDASATGRFVEFFVTPANATLELGDELLVLEGGHAQKFKEFGQYHFKANAPNYHDSIGVFTVARSADETENHRVRITLRPAFGFLELEADDSMKDAVVFIDNMQSGNLPFKSGEVKSGQHTLRIAKNLYKTYEQIITIEDGKTLTLRPVLQPNFAVTTLEVDADAEIWVNGQKMGTRRWQGPLEIGNYKVECRQENHEPMSQNISITSNTEARTFTLQAPIPIYGGVRITSSPSQADVYIDGEKMPSGTPFYSPRVIIGKHTLSIRKEGYGNATREIEVTRDVTDDYDFKLTNIIDVAVTSSPDSARVIIDGTYRGLTPFRSSIAAGKHSVQIERKGYYRQSRDVNIDGSSPTVHFNLQKNTTTVTVNSNHSGAYVSVDDGYERRTPATFELSHGSHKFVATRWGHYRGEKTVRIDASVTQLTVNMTRDMIHRNSFYLDLMYKSGELKGYGGNLGFYAGNVNFEGSFYLPAGAEEKSLFWYRPGESYLQGSTLVKPQFEFGGKMGYGIRLGKRIRVTPQFGARYLLLKDSGEFQVENMGTLFGVASMRVSLVLVNGIALTVVPEYAFPIKESDGYKYLKERDDAMKKWCDGTNIFAGLSFFL